MSFPAYPAYKDSTISWLGRVPSDWSIAPIKAIASCNDEVLSESTDDESVIEYVEISGVEEGRGITETETLAFGKAPSRARRVVRHGDVILSTVRTYLRAIATISNPPENLVASTGFAVIRPRGVHPGFLGYLLHAEYFMSEVIARSVGISYPAINASDLMRLKAPIPSLHEQRAIAAFLDRETAKIDALVEEQKRLIELLKEKRQAVISQAVTKGLDPSVPMKDSGVAWLGEVPAHWEVYRNKVLFKEIDDRSDDGVGDLMTVSHLTGVTRRSEKNVNMILAETLDGYKRGGSGDLVINTMWAWMGALGVSPCDGLFSPSYNVYRIRNPSRLLPSYYDYLCRVQQHVTEMRSRSTGIWESRLRLYPDVFLDMRVCVPPPAEQAAIVSTIVRRLGALDALNTAAEQGIQLLQERRSALISAAVTGKIDVRGLVPQPEVTAA